MEEESEAGENVKDSKSDSEMYKDVSPSKKSKGDKKAVEKQRKLRLDQKWANLTQKLLFFPFKLDVQQFWALLFLRFSLLQVEAKIAQ